MAQKLMKLAIVADQKEKSSTSTELKNLLEPVLKRLDALQADIAELKARKFPAPEELEAVVQQAVRPLMYNLQDHTDLKIDNNMAQLLESGVSNTIDLREEIRDAFLYMNYEVGVDFMETRNEVRAACRTMAQVKNQVFQKLPARGHLITGPILTSHNADMKNYISSELHKMSSKVDALTTALATMQLKPPILIDGNQMGEKDGKEADSGGIEIVPMDIEEPSASAQTPAPNHEADFIATLKRS